MQSAKCKMENETKNLSERLLDFGVRIIKLTTKLNKMQIVLKELRESLYWLKLLERSKLIPSEDLHPLLSEANELVKIVAKSVITAKSKGK
jgi:hypothetical protein